MTKYQFLKTYGQPNTVVSFKNDAEKMEFLKECERFEIRWRNGDKATKYNTIRMMISMDKGSLMSGDRFSFGYLEFKTIPYAPSPKSRIKDGWMGVRRNGEKIYFIPSMTRYVTSSTHAFLMDSYLDDLTKVNSNFDIMELYDNLGNLQWKRDSTKDIKIERIQAEMNKLADDLSKLKGEQ